MGGGVVIFLRGWGNINRWRGKPSLLVSETNLRRWSNMMKRMIAAGGVSLLLTALMVWAHECQRPTPNCPQDISDGTRGTCPDREPCTWRVTDVREERGVFCSGQDSRCPNHSPRTGPCSARQRWVLTVRTLQCEKGDGTPCRTIQCIASVRNEGSVGTDCEGHPCTNHPRAVEPAPLPIPK